MIGSQSRKHLRLAVPALITLLFSASAMAADTPAHNSELEQIYDADQRDREGPVGKPYDAARVTPRDVARRKRVRELIEQERLKTGIDFERAAMVFQHGDSPDDFLLAHVLAMTAVGKGNLEARWLSAATLDRFLRYAGQPQIFGTSFSATIKEGEISWTMEPYNRTLITPYLRRLNCVADLQNQTETLDTLQAGKEPETPQRPCAEPSQ